MKVIIWHLVPWVGDYHARMKMIALDTMIFYRSTNFFSYIKLELEPKS